MSDLQGRIWSEIAKVAHGMPNYESVSEQEWLARGDAEAAAATDRIIAAIREAITSEEAAYKETGMSDTTGSASTPEKVKDDDMEPVVQA